MALPVISQYLLSGQSAMADASQPKQANIPGGLSGVTVVQAGCVVVNTEKLGLETTSHHVNWASGVTFGEVVIEVADEITYTGPWVVMQTVTFNGQSPKQDVVKVDGSYGAYRHRITQPVVGGSVTTKIVGTT